LAALYRTIRSATRFSRAADGDQDWAEVLRAVFVFWGEGFTTGCFPVEANRTGKTSPGLLHGGGAMNVECGALRRFGFRKPL